MKLFALGVIALMDAALAAAAADRMLLARQRGTARPPSTPQAAKRAGLNSPPGPARTIFPSAWLFNQYPIWELSPSKK